MITSNYGSYTIPPLLIDVIALQRQLNQEGLLAYGDLLGLYFNIEPIDARYQNNPLDYIPFATTGMDGIGYGFITDFGQVSTLEDAYIVRTSPMDFDNPVRIVARNLQDFLSLFQIDFDILLNLDIFSTPAQFEQLTKSKQQSSNNYYANLTEAGLTQLKESEAIAEQHASIVRARYASIINSYSSSIDSIPHYFSYVKEERQLNIVIPTSDTIGVVAFPSRQNAHAQATTIDDSPRHNQLTITCDTQISLEEAKTYFSYASNLAKLAFIREATSYGLLYTHPQWLPLIEQTLQTLKLEQECIRLHFPKQHFSTYSTPGTTHIAYFKDEQ